MKQSLVWKGDNSVEEALRLLDANGNGTLPVIDENKRLIGLITDGDIRRGLLNKKTELKDFINYNPKTLKTGTTLQQALQFLQQNHLRQVIITNEDKHITDVIVLDDIEITSRTNHVVIMAGGLGSRLGELTKDIPKPMLNVGGKPILQNIIESFKEFGYVNFIVCVNYMSHIIENYFGDGSGYGVKILYNHESKRMGTAGALSLIERKFDEPFFVVNGDVLTTLDYQDFMNFHQRQASVATICVKKYNHQVPYAQVNIDDNHTIVSLEEKPILDYYINAGIYILNPEALEYIPHDSFYDMPTLFEELISRSIPTKAYRMDSDYWVDVGKKEDYNQANIDFKTK